MLDDSTQAVPRRLAPEEAAAAAALIRLAFAAQPIATDPPSSALRETGASVAAALEGGAGFAVDGRQGLAAVLLVAERDGGLYCGRLAVDPAARGQGLAADLMAEAEREARRRGLPRLHVRVRLSLTGNLRFFAGLGFDEIGRDAHAGYAEPTTVMMEKRLTA